MTMRKLNGFLQYVKGVSQNFKKLVKEHSLNLAFTSYNSLNKYIKTGKNQLDPLSRCCVVYKINCQDCDASYMGQQKDY